VITLDVSPVAEGDMRFGFHKYQNKGVIMNRVSFGSPFQEEEKVKLKRESSMALKYRSVHSFKESRNDSHNKDQMEFILG